MDPPRYGFAGLPAAVADTRRRQTYCKGACRHAWHNLRGDRAE